IEDPGCFWVTVKGCGPYIVDEIEYKKLNAEMNQFYDKSCEDMDEVKPITLEKDQICVVFSEELKCWCRAVVTSIMYCADHYQIGCFLVDYAKSTFVKSKDVRVAVEAFMQIPFRAKKCRLYCIKPVTLNINICEDRAQIVPAKRWDTAATQYFRSLLEATTQIKAKLCAVEDNVFHVILYVTVEGEKVGYFYICKLVGALCNIKVCINDDLVSKNFAHFEKAEENIQSPAEEQENQTSLNVVNPAFALRPAQLQEKVPVNLEAGYNVSSSSLEKTYQRSNVDLNESNESVFLILEYYKKNLITAEWKYSPRQIIAVGTQWNRHIQSLIKEFMDSPYIVITALEEASIYGNVQQVVQHCVSSEKTAELLKILDFTPNNVQKVLVFTNSIDEVEIVHEDSSDQEHQQARSVILLTESSECRSVEILRCLERAEAGIPPGLSDFLDSVLEAEERKKLGRPLCTYLKMFGTCKNRTVCPDRHQINLQTDMLQNVLDRSIQTSVYVTVLPLHIVNATNYFGRIVDKQKDEYSILAEEINEYYKETSNRVTVEKVEKLALYGFCEETVFHRVQVVETSLKVEIKYIDEGRTSQVQSSQLLHLPARFQHLPPQAKEFVVCRVKPIDNDIEWNPRVTRYIHQKIRRKPHEAKVVLMLGNTVWIDPMVRVTRLSNLKICISEYSVRSEILSTGLGTDNPEHVLQLQKLCEHVKVLNHMKNLEPLSVEEDTAGPENVNELQNMSFEENSSENCNSSKTTMGSHLCDCVAQTKEAEDSSLRQQKWYKVQWSCYCTHFLFFYPEIKWFENEESVTVKVKIMKIADYKCEFSTERVIFSACSGGKFYLADMELYQRILAEKSACVIKDKEAVIVLRKEKKGSWCKLLKNKNPHVSFDFEYLKDFEDKSPFPVGTGKLHFADPVMEELTDSWENSDSENDD
ncbi:UNVERIFIED_CONTAM: hypothetical protein H355_015519, partial [Colinus virginianus]